MEQEDSSLIDRCLARLSENPADRDAVITLAKHGRVARRAAPFLLQLLIVAEDPLFRALCMDALASLLEGGSDEEANATVTMLARALEEEAFHRMRGKIARTLLKIGFAARSAIPTLARVVRRGARCSVRVPARCALSSLAAQCWMSESRSTQMLYFQALEGVSPAQRRWILDRRLAAEDGGTLVRDEARRVRESLGQPEE